MQERKSTLLFGQDKQRTKNEAANGRCRQHPEFDLDTICFHQQCRQKHNQIICHCCGSQEQPHVSHTQELYPIFRTSPGFRLVSFQNEPSLQAWVAQQRQRSSQMIEKLQMMVISALGEVATQSQQRLECFGDFLQKNGIYKICSRMRHFSDTHTHCCLALLNSLKDLDLQGQGQTTSSQTREMIKSKIEMESQLIKSQTDFIWNQFQAIMQKALKLNQEPSQQLSSSKVAISEIIPLEQRFPQIATASITKEKPALKQQSIEVEEVMVKTSQSTIIRNQKAGRNEIYLDAQPVKPKKSFIKNQKLTKASKELREGNETNKSNPIDLDEASMGVSNSDSIIDDLAASAIKEPTNQHQQSKLRSKTSEKYDLQCQEFPIGTNLENPQSLAIWNGSKFEEILKFLSSARQVLHLIILDKQIAKEQELLKIIDAMPWLAGLHLHCDSLITSNVVNQLKASYFSYFVSARLIQAADRIKYFPRNQPTMLEVLPSCLLSKPSRFRNVFIQNSDCSAIDVKTEEVSFVQDNSDVFWVFGLGLEKHLLKPDKLMVLVFRRILIRKSVDFKEVYARHRSLHTITFDNCECQHNEIVYQMRHLREGQLVHFQLSGDSLDHKIQLGEEEADVIFSQTSLETLILEHVEFKTIHRKGQEKDSSKILKKIQSLARLSHLNLYNTEPVYSEIVSYLNPKCIGKLRTLNLGCTEINHSITQSMQKLTRLENLLIDYTEIGESELLAITNKMKNLKQLSVENLNGTRIVYEENSHNKSKKTYGLLSSNFFNRLKRKTLQYINIFNCSSLKECDWTNYPQLECIRVNKDLLMPEAISKLEGRGVKVYVDDAENEEESFEHAKEKHKKAGHSSSLENEKKPKKSHQSSSDTLKRSTLPFTNTNGPSTARQPNENKSKYMLRRSQINAEKSPLRTSGSRNKY